MEVLSGSSAQTWRSEVGLKQILAVAVRVCHFWMLWSERRACSLKGTRINIQTPKQDALKTTYSFVNGAADGMQKVDKVFNT